MTSIEPAGRWYDGITRYQWLVLLISCLGWIFDQFESQVFVASMNRAIPDLSPADTDPGTIAMYQNVSLGAFLLGGALGGIGFGILSDRFGRKRTMAWTILFYSLFTALSAFAGAWWHLAIFRFLVAIGVGGEWAVASALVAEVFPDRARAHVGAIFHASSVLGTYLAVAAGVFILANPFFTSWAQEWNLPSLPWRACYLIGAIPALLILWIRLGLRESDRWLADQSRQQAPARWTELFSGPFLVRTLLGVTLATIGLATFWGTHIFGKDLFLEIVRPTIDEAVPHRDEILKRWEMLGMFLVTTGGGIGLVSFGPACEWFGRRWAFAFFHLGGFVASMILFRVVTGTTQAMIFLPIFGFLTLGMHAGYAVYFPELYPTRLRATGTGFCFNAARILTSPMIVLAGWLQQAHGFSLAEAASLLSFLFLAGLVILPFAPETKGRPLPQS